MPSFSDKNREAVMADDRSNVRKEIANLIRFIRGKRVMLDSDLAELYSVETKQLNRAVKRNLERFPEDFMFQLSNKELRT